MTTPQTSPDTTPGVGTEDAPAATEPDTEELTEPSTEKDPGEEPKAPHSGDDGEPEPSHRAEGIGVIAPDGPDADEAPV